MFLLMSATPSTPLRLVASITSATSWLCPIVFLLFMIRTIAACVSKLRSACTCSCVALFSAAVSLSWTWLILMRYFSCEKEALTVKVSVGLMSRPGSVSDRCIMREGQER